jgi:Protein of unknown function (DUF3011)/Peptidase inhibitor family I36
MKRSCFGFVLLAFLVCLFVPPKASAQHSEVQTIVCESHHHKVQFCPIPDPRSSVVMVEQLGDAQCVRGETWGNDAKGIWVDRGCRARFEVRVGPEHDPGWWNSGSHGPSNRPHSGACFFKNVNFTGEYFCSERGSNIPQVRLDDEISSIQILGHATVTIYKDPRFSGPQATTDRSIPDLHHWRMPNNPNLNWDNRISSARID